MAKVGTQNNTHKRRIADRWGPALVDEGFTPLSNYFLKNYHRLTPRLRPSEVLILIHLMTFKWDLAHPRPAFRTLAKRMGVTPSAVRAHARNLERKGFVKRYQRVGQTNRFNLDPFLERMRDLKKSDEHHEKQRPTEESDRLDAAISPVSPVSVTIYGAVGAVLPIERGGGKLRHGGVMIKTTATT